MSTMSMSILYGSKIAYRVKHELVSDHPILIMALLYSIWSSVFCDFENLLLLTFKPSTPRCQINEFEQKKSEKNKKIPKT